MAQNEGVSNGYKLLVIGGSAGSLEPIIAIISSLPSPLQLAVVVILHRKPGLDSSLHHLLAAKTALPVKEVEDKDALLPGTIYIAPPDYHLLIEAETSFMLDASEKIHFSRPGIDAAFESAADVFGPSLIGILLSGASADGADGLRRIKEAGGHVIVQDPQSAEVSYMPEQALLLVKPDKVLAFPEIVNHLATLLTRV